MTASNTCAAASPYPSLPVGPVLLVTPWYRPTIGGVVEVAERLRRLLTACGVDTHLLVCEEENSPKQIVQDPEKSNIWRFRIPAYIFHRVGLGPILGMLLRSPLAFYRLFRFIRNHRVRTVILIYPTATSWPWLIFRSMRSIRLILSYHGNDILKYDSYSKLLKWLVRCTIRSADATIVPAKHLGEKAQDLCRDRLLRISVIPNCVNTNELVPAPAVAPERNVGLSILHISNFAPKKRTLDIIEAFAMAPVPSDCRLVMVGYGPDFDSAIAYARTLGITDRVNFVGAQQDVRHFLWNADLLVMASDEESGPLTLLEAMACELPWIATPWGVSTMIPEGECGLIVPCRCTQDLATAMAKLINDPLRRHLMGKRGRQRAVADFGEDKYLERHLRLIADLEQ